MAQTMDNRKRGSQHLTISAMATLLLNLCRSVGHTAVMPVLPTPRAVGHTRAECSKTQGPPPSSSQLESYMAI
jgi:hypothetical protein